MNRLFLIFLFALPAVADMPSAGSRDGEVHVDAGHMIVWDAEQEAWVSPTEFWQAFAARERGRNWGRADRFPNYADVNEHDAIIIETEDGACLMYFFHRRWRRANDVWRWDPAFNTLGGCATVFDNL